MQKPNRTGGLLGYALLALSILVVGACRQQAQPEVVLEDWQVAGGSSDEQYWSSLDLIDDGNVGDLGLAWFADFDTRRGQEANVVMADGVLYTSTAWSKVYAFDARTGKQLWMFDPLVAGSFAYWACCDVVNRGVAVAGGKVFVGTLDGRLVALDAKTGAKLWDMQTTDRKQPYTITGAPRVAGDLVLIGNAGGEYGVRGYVTAYAAETGKQAWRFYTVPGDPAKGPDGAASDPQMAMASRTWAGKWYEYGGGGTVWDAIVYDREFDQVLIGTGNGSPWNHRIRSEGKGDNLFLSSIVALDAKTGAYKWHFQETPGESWDFTATQPIVLATLRIGDELRKVAMQAPKNGFFYVIDRKTGKLVSAKNFVPVNWASGVDQKTGRPIETASARYYRTGKGFAAIPAFLGAHNWHPMAYSPKTGLVYIPAQTIRYGYADQGRFAFRPGEYNIGVVPIAPDAKEAALNGGAIIAWDPVKQEARWRLPQKWPGNGGILATGGNLLFQGSPDGTFNAYDAQTGKKLWSADAGSGVIAAASTYLLDGEQYVAVVAGLGGSSALFAGILPRPGHLPNGRLLVFKPGGKASLPQGPALDPPTNPPAAIADPAIVRQGALGYAFNCTFCHGKDAAATAILPDLRRSPALSDAGLWKEIVHDGALEANGMIGFKAKLTPAEVEAIRLYIGEQARALGQGGAKR